MGMFSLYPKRRIRKLLSEGEYGRAIGLGLDLEPKYAGDADYMFIMGSAYMLVDDAARALAYFEKAVGIDGRDVEALKLKTNAHLALGQADEAARCIGTILDIEPENDEALELRERLDGAK